MTESEHLLEELRKMNYLLIRILRAVGDKDILAEGVQDRTLRLSKGAL